MRYFIYCRKSSETEDRQVLSIESQLTTLKRAFEGRSEIDIVGIYEEAYSAKAPGRPLFSEMLSRIEAGNADGIIAWAPDRLARNSIDGGRIVYLLDRGMIHDLKFATYTFENNSQGKFMLQIMFGQSKYYSDALSENVKRGNRTKIEKGWRPNQAPLGYLNDPATKTIVKDPVHFPLVRKMYDLMLTDTYSPKQIALIARDEWGFRTPRKKRIGGKPLAMSSIYKILGNPFYAGIIVWNGETHPGRHEPVVTLDEFQRVRSMLHRPGRIRPQRHTFAFTGMIRCGGCGLSVTAEHKINRYGRRYTYYHCSKRQLGPRCREPSVELRFLERQIEDFLRTLAIDPRVERWVLEEITAAAGRHKDTEQARKASLEAALRDIVEQLKALTGLRLRNLLADEEFVAQRQELQAEKIRLARKLSDTDNTSLQFEPAREVLSFNSRAADWFIRGDIQSKRLILQTVGSNLSLKDKIVNVAAAKPFISLARAISNPNQLGFIDDIRTFQSGKKRWLSRLIKEIFEMRHTDDGQLILNNIRMLRERFEPESLVKEKRRRRRAVAA